MIVDFKNGRFYLNSQDEELGTLHTKMIEDFKVIMKLLIK